MTYDLQRLRPNGLIRRLPHTNRYTLTSDGIRIAVFYTKVYNRLLVPLTAADQAQAPPELRAALVTITRHVDDYANRARLPCVPRNSAGLEVPIAAVIWGKGSLAGRGACL